MISAFDLDKKPAWTSLRTGRPYGGTNEQEGFLASLTPRSWRRATTYRIVITFVDIYVLDGNNVAQMIFYGNSVTKVEPVNKNPPSEHVSYS